MSDRPHNFRAMLKSARRDERRWREQQHRRKKKREFARSVRRFARTKPK